MEAVPLRRGALVVFEGLDRAGKTTQINELRARLRSDTVTFAHMPSGFSPFTRTVRDLLEDTALRPRSGVAQQLAHLACHAEANALLGSRLEVTGMVLDRWWWSTLAYGWYGGPVAEAGLSYEVFRALIDAVWHDVRADVVFLFGSPHEADANNSSFIAAGYEELALQFPEICVRVGNGPLSEVTAQILDELDRRNLVGGQ